MYGNGRPLTRKQLFRLTVGVVILCWATQVLLAQWARGQDVPNETATISRPVENPPVLPEEKFIAARPNAPMAGGTIELKSEAAVFGTEVRLKQICRWSQADAALFTSIADLVVVRFDSRGSFKSISMDELQTTLGNAKANLAVIRFTGPLLCTVRRTDNPADPATALDQWITARQPAAPDTAAKTAEKAEEPKPILASDRTPAAAPATADASPLKTLRQLLTEDLSVRLRVPVDQLQINFNPKDERVLNLPEPQFKFNIEAVRARSLGPVEWNVLVVHAGAMPGGPETVPASQKLSIGATARAWQNQILLARPLTFRQPILAGDLIEKRELVESMTDETLLTKQQVVGQQASRDLKPGTIMTARMVEAVELVKAGQYVSVNVNQGAVRIKTVGKAMESGSFGQVIRVKNEETNDTYQVQMTGPQEGSVGGPLPTETPLAAR